MTKVYLSAGADDRLVQHFVNMGHQTELISTEGLVSEPVSDHPDMFMCRLGIVSDAPVISYWDIAEKHSGVDRPAGSEAALLSPGYPEEVAFNAACTGRYFIHNLNYTAPQLLSAARDKNMVMIDVKQGYAKCSTVIVDENSIITYDRGLGRKCAEAGMDVLLIDPGHVVLNGYESGFLGGASGRISDTVYFNGDLTAHPDFIAIRTFIEERGLRLKWFEDWPLTDIGSIL